MKKINIAMTHIGFWIIVMAIRLPMLTRVDDQISYLSVLLLSFSFHVIIFYLFYLYFSQIILKKHVSGFVLFFLIFIVLYSIPITYLFIFGYKKLLCFGFIKPDKEQEDFLKTYISVLTSQSIYATIGTFFRLSVDWFRNIRHQEELEKQNIKNELALLRSQINPHFLFNTLNNIHSFVHRDQDKTAFGIIKLSEIMRYMLYETNAEKVLLEKEIKYISDYIDLQKLRLKDPDFVKFNIEGDIAGKFIPPLLLISFVENAFKHCKVNSPNSGISIVLKTENNSLTFEVINCIKKDLNNIQENNGFGLKNLQRRLDLIYGENYRLDKFIDNEKYHIRLVISSL
jgi:two-component system, LytTR family, sensor kinase